MALHVLIVTDVYPPMRTSGAVQLFDLGQAFRKAGHAITVIVPVASQDNRVKHAVHHGCEVITVRAFQTKEVNYVRRTLAEFVNPFWIWFYLQRTSVLRHQKIDGIIWYSPTIFWGPLVRRLKKKFGCPAYLILRDLFPDWALDLGVLKKGPIYTFLKKVERYQYAQANVIGAQSPNNAQYLERQFPDLHKKIEVLWNWIGAPALLNCPITLSNTLLSGKTILVYAGNMGLAQGMDALLDLARSLDGHSDLGLLFVGRGSEVPRLKASATHAGLSNILFLDEIDPASIPSLFAQCHIGLIALDSRHTTHNIPGKLLTYLQAGLPIIALVNPDNDLLEVVQKNRVGVAITDSAKLLEATLAVQHLRQTDVNLSARCTELATTFFSATTAMQQIAKHFKR